MRKQRGIVIGIIMLMFMTQTIQGSDLISKVERYGKAITFSSSEDYTGTLSFDGFYVYEDGEDYVFTALYSGGDIKINVHDHRQLLSTSFFNPPEGDVLKEHTFIDNERIDTDDEKMVFRIDQAQLRSVPDGISILVNENGFELDDRFSIYISDIKVHLENVPTKESLTTLVNTSTKALPKKQDETLASWAQKDIDELSSYKVLRESEFGQWQNQLTRVEFVYLMVRLYEEATGSIVVPSDDISFSDTTDLNAYKAAEIGITKGVGGDLFAPDQLVSREQMTTFMIRTLEIAGIDLSTTGNIDAFADNDAIHDWAREAVYKAKAHNLMNGIGDNKFSPTGSASRQQGLVITNRLMKKYAGYVWYESTNADRVYLRIQDKLYRTDFKGKVYYDVDATSGNFYLEDLEDVNLLMDVSAQSHTPILQEADSNPNVEGLIKVNDTSRMTLTQNKLYRGVDTIGTETVIQIKDSFNQEIYKALVKHMNNGLVTYSQYDQIRAYGDEDELVLLKGLPLNQILTLLGVECQISYNDTWDIFEIEIVK